MHRERLNGVRTHHTSGRWIIYDLHVKTFAETVVDYIERQGHKTDASPPDAGITYIAFRSRGLWFYAVTNEDDHEFLQISCSMPLAEHVSVDSKALELLLEIQDRLKALKFAPLGEDRKPIAHVELLLSDGAAYEATFWRAVGIVETGMRRAVAALEENSAAKTAAEKFINEFSLGRAQ